MVKRLVVLGIVVVAAASGWSVLRGSESDRIFYGRAWIDHVPKERTETFQVFGTVKKNPFGWVARRAAWKGEWEAFRYERRGEGQIEVLFPHSQKKVRMTFRAWKCDEQKLDYCLELTGDGQTTKYYSKKQWTRDDMTDGQLDAELAAGLE